MQCNGETSENPSQNRRQDAETVLTVSGKQAHLAVEIPRPKTPLFLHYRKRKGKQGTRFLLLSDDLQIHLWNIGERLPSIHRYYGCSSAEPRFSDVNIIEGVAFLRTGSWHLASQLMSEIAFAEFVWKAKLIHSFSLLITWGLCSPEWTISQQAISLPSINCRWISPRSDAVFQMFIYLLSGHWLLHVGDWEWPKHSLGIV